MRSRKSIWMSKVDKLGATPAKIDFASYMDEAARMSEVFALVRKGEKQKIDLPAIIPAGVFKGGYQMGHLKRLNGMASFDIDKMNNVDAVKSELSNLPWVYYLSKSISGNGLWGLVRFKDPNQYVWQYSGLLMELQEMGIDADWTGANINRLRFYSYDPDYYLNESAEIFARMEMLLRSKDGKTVDYRVDYQTQFTKREAWRIKAFNESHDCEALFEEAGWEVMRQNYAGQVDVLRPGSDKGRSGNIKENKFWCFTDSTSFKQSTLNSAFDCYVHLFHDGDVKAALRAIR